MFNFLKAAKTTAEPKAEEESYWEWELLGRHGSLAKRNPDEQRLYDAYKHLLDNFNGHLDSCFGSYISIWDTKQDLALRVNSLQRSVSVSRKDTSFVLELPENVHAGIAQNVSEALERKEDKDTRAATWPLPTVWDKPKARKKGK